MTGGVLRQIVLVGAGGFVGSALRYVVSGSVQRLSGTGGFPFGTLAVNVIGCLLIGLLAGLAEYRQLLTPGQRLFLMVGILGGFTTFSTFGYETLALAQDGEHLKAAANAMLQVLLGVAAVFAGMIVARSL